MQILLLPCLYLSWKILVLEMPSLLDLVVKLKKQVDRLSNNSRDGEIQKNSIPVQENHPSSSHSSHGLSSNCPTDSDVESEQLVTIKSMFDSPI